MHTHMCITYINKTSIQWTPGSQAYLSKNNFFLQIKQISPAYRGTHSVVTNVQFPSKIFNVKSLSQASNEGIFKHPSKEMYNNFNDPPQAGL